MSRLTDDERALPKPGKMPRAEAWQQALAHRRLLNKVRFDLTKRYMAVALKFGVDVQELQDTVTAAAWEGLLVAVEQYNPNVAKFSTFACMLMEQRAVRSVHRLLWLKTGKDKVEDDLCAEVPLEEVGDPPDVEPQEEVLEEITLQEILGQLDDELRGIAEMLYAGSKQKEIAQEMNLSKWKFRRLFAKLKEDLSEILERRSKNAL